MKRASSTFLETKSDALERLSKATGQNISVSLFAQTVPFAQAFRTPVYGNMREALSALKALTGRVTSWDNRDVIVGIYLFIGEPALAVPVPIAAYKAPVLAPNLVTSLLTGPTSASAIVRNAFFLSDVVSLVLRSQAAREQAFGAVGAADVGEFLTAIGQALVTTAGSAAESNELRSPSEIAFGEPPSEPEPEKVGRGGWRVGDEFVTSGGQKGVVVRVPEHNGRMLEISWELPVQIGKNKVFHQRLRTDEMLDPVTGKRRDVSVPPIFRAAPPEEGPKEPAVELDEETIRIATLERIDEPLPAGTHINTMLHEFIKQIEPTNQTIAQAAATLVPDAAKIAQGERVRATYIGMQIKGDKLVVTAYAVPDVREYPVRLRIIERAPRVAGDTLADMMKMDKLQFSTPREPVILEPKTSGIMQRITIRDVGNLEGIASATPGSSMSFAFMADGMMPGPLTSLITAMGRRSGKPVEGPPQAIGVKAMERRMAELAKTGGVVVLPSGGDYSEGALRAIADVVKANANVHAIASGSRSNIEGMSAKKRDVFESMFNVLYTVSLPERDIVQIARRINEEADAAKEAPQGTSPAMPGAGDPIPVSGEPIGKTEPVDREADRIVDREVTRATTAIKEGKESISEARQSVVEAAEQTAEDRGDDPEHLAREGTENFDEAVSEAFDDGALEEVDGKPKAVPPKEKVEVDDDALKRKLTEALLGGSIEDDIAEFKKALGIN